MSKKLIYGVGLNDSDYVVKIQDSYHIDGKRKRRTVWRCPYYTRWEKMLSRCYSDKPSCSSESYSECYVCDEWLVFSNFKDWMIKQEDLHGDLRDLQLDKDIISRGNKIYCPEKCAFVPANVNGFVLDRKGARGKHLIGVYWNKRESKFYSKCVDPFTHKSVFLGLYESEEEGHLRWLACKHKFACDLAGSGIIKDSRVVEALKNRYRYGYEE